MAVDEKVISKIQKMLAKANDDACTPEEAQAFMLKAQEFMAKHSLSMTDVAFKEEKKEVLENRAAMDWKKAPYWYGRLAQVIAHNFRCYSYKYTRRGKMQEVFLGLKDDTEMCVELFKFSVTYLEHKLMLVRLGAKRRGKTQYEANGSANDFVIGFIDGLGDQFHEQVKKNEWGLILVKDQDVVAAHDKMKFRNGGHYDPNRSYDHSYYSAGYEQGKNFSKPNGLIEG